MNRPLSIRARLLLNGAVATGLALLLAGGVLAYFEYREQRQSYARMLEVRAAVIAGNAQSPLEFEDAEVAAEVLQSLQADRAIVFAGIYKADGELLAHYPLEAEALPNAPRSGVQFEDQAILVSQPIVIEGEARGALVLRCDLAPVVEAIHARIRVLILILIAAMTLAILLAGRLQQRVSGPILELTETTQQVTEHGDYSVRADKMRDDEIGLLTDAFNGMLDDILSRDEALRRSRDQLEDRVRDRTAELEEAMYVAEAASRAKTDFLANMSHEIRTPMNAILGYADLMLLPDQTAEERVEATRVIARNGHHLMSVINDVLDISKIEAGRMTVERIECDPWSLLEEVGSLMSQRASEKGIELAIEHRGAIPETVTSDPTRLRQVLLNLVGNAIKFTESGSVRVVMELAGVPVETSEHPRLRWHVIDTGIGLGEEELASLFQPFTQADESMTRKYGGTGLGLAISRRLAELLGGTVSVVSEKGKGSTFTIEIDSGDLSTVALLETPKIRAEKAAPPSEASDRGEDSALSSEVADPLSWEKPSPTKTAKKRKGPKISGRVLLVEDGPDNQRLIAFVLEKAGATVEVAENGRIGLDRARAAWESEEPFDVVLMDMQMPEMDGYTATSLLRKAQYPYPVVALTAHAMAGDRERCLDAGCDDFTTKPIDRVGLIELVHDWMQRHDETRDRWTNEATLA
ncbi:MAG: ATP-binding protein [Planctomycetota bacterium]